MELLRSESQGEREPKARWLLALLGVATLGGGYALVRSSGGEVISAAEQTEEGEQISVRLADGALDCRVEKKRRL